jgi:hypothetical protein
MAELTVMVELGGRQVEMRKPTDGALVVLARVSRTLPTSMIENVDEIPQEVRDKLIRNLGTLGKVVEGMIVQDADKDWLDDAMIDGDVSAEEVFGSIRAAAEKINGQAAPAKKAAPVRRRSQ